mgnify:CR=1 FL=1
MENTENYLECERNRVYYTLIAIAGFFGAYTFLLRGKVFCNAQTGNLVLLGLQNGKRQPTTCSRFLRIWQVHLSQNCCRTQSSII